MALGIAGALGLSAGANLLGGLLGADAQKDAARIAANASLFRPVNITSGIGTVTAGGKPGNVSFETQLSPELQALRDQLMGIGSGYLPQVGMFDQQLGQNLQDINAANLTAGGLFQAATGYDPQQFSEQKGQEFTNYLRTLSAPEEQKQRTQLENRLFKQGLLSSSSGAERFGELNQAQAMADVQRQLQGAQAGWQMGQDVQTNLANQYKLGLANIGTQTALRNQLLGEREGLFNLGLGGIQGATTLDNLLAQQLNQSISAGGAQTSANMAGANFQFQAGMNRGDAISGFFSSLGNTAAQYAFQPQNPIFGYEQQYNFQGNMPFGPEAFGPQ